MPVYTYRCRCGRTADVLVKGGDEPRTCDDAPRDFAGCADAGELSRQLSAPYIGKGEGSGAVGRAAQGCDHCNAPEGCDDA